MLRRLWIGVGWALVAGVIYGSLMHSPPSLGFQQGDKLEHLGSYGLLMFWFCQLYVEPRVRLGYALGFVALGVALEFVQGWTGYRDFEVADMFADAAGVALGWGAALIFPKALPGAETGTRSTAR
ncbi:MAG: VanZ family protein [Sphingomonadaceae bacterium]